MTNFIGGHEFEPQPGEVFREVLVRVQIETSQRVITEYFRGESAHVQSEAWADEIREHMIHSQEPRT